jgi:hypothetical protein
VEILAYSPMDAHHAQARYPRSRGAMHSRDRTGVRDGRRRSLWCAWRA